MKKLHLNPDALRVESFQTLPAGPGERGTVHGQATPETWEDILSCGGGCDGLDGLVPATLVSCARQQSNVYSCFYECECTNARYACIAPREP